MKKIKILALILLAVLLFNSCNGNSGNTDNSDSSDAGGSLTVSTGNEDALTLFENGASKYTIIYPSDAVGAVIGAATFFQTEFEKATGVKLPIKDDYLKKGQTRTESDEDSYKILIGTTNYTETAAFMKDVRFYDYAINYTGNKLVIAGYGEEELCEAILWLSENVFSKYNKAKGDAMRFNDEVKFDYGRYAIDSFTVGSGELKNFSFVYGSSTDKALAESMRDTLARRYGYFLNIISDTADKLTDKEILVGNTNREISQEIKQPTYLNYLIEEASGNIVIKTGGEHSAAYLSENFLSNFEINNKKITMDEGTKILDNMYTDPYANNVVPSDSDLRIMSANVLAGLQGYGGDEIPVSQRSEIFFSSLDYYQPAVIGLQEFCKNWFSAFETYENKDKYSMISADNHIVKGEQYLTAILYRNDLLELVGEPGFQYYSTYNNGRCRVMSWAVFKVKATGKQFIFFNTHWDGGSNDSAMIQCNEAIAKINELRTANPGIPVFCTADWNSNEWTNQFKKFTTDLGLQNAKTSAVRKLNQIGSWHEFGKDTPSAGSADHIFASNDSTVVQFETLITNEQIWCSDHSFLVADVKW